MIFIFLILIFLYFLYSFVVISILTVVFISICFVSCLFSIVSCILCFMLSVFVSIVIASRLCLLSISCLSIIIRFFVNIIRIFSRVCIANPCLLFTLLFQFQLTLLIASVPIDKSYLNTHIKFILYKSATHLAHEFIARICLSLNLFQIVLFSYHLSYFLKEKPFAFRKIFVILFGLISLLLIEFETPVQEFAFIN